MRVRSGRDYLFAPFFVIGHRQRFVHARHTYRVLLLFEVASLFFNNKRVTPFPKLKEGFLHVFKEDDE